VPAPADLWSFTQVNVGDFCDHHRVSTRPAPKTDKCLKPQATVQARTGSIRISVR
jgi:hypothetical protein